MGYDTFTKAIVLPQNLFDQFLKGDKEKRREVLEEILSLKLFETVASRAGEKGRILKELLRQNEGRLAELASESSAEKADALQKGPIEASLRRTRNSKFSTCCPCAVVSSAASKSLRCDPSTQSTSR